MKQGGTMKRIAYLFAISMIILTGSDVSAESGYFTCGSDIRNFNGKTFEDLTIDIDRCKEIDADLSVSADFEEITVTGECRLLNSGSGIDSAEIKFSGSSLNEVYAYFSAKKSRIELDRNTSIRELHLNPSRATGNSITVSGTPENSSLPPFYEQGFLCEGQKEFEAYSGLDNEISFRMKDLEVFADMGYAGEILLQAAEGVSVTFENIWIHKVKILSEESKPEEFTINTKGMTYIDLIDSGSSFSLHNLNERHFSGEIPPCSAVASDFMRIGLMFLHSAEDLTVAMDNQYVDRLVFFGNGCENSTLNLTDRLDSGMVSHIEEAAVYDANAEFYAKNIPYVEFLIAPDNFTVELFYELFDIVKNALMDKCKDLPDMRENSALCRNISQFPEHDSPYWDTMESAKIWSRLSNYVQIPAGETGSADIPYTYFLTEPDIPYFYTHAAFIDTVKFSAAYGTPETAMPSYITEKGWASLNPTSGPNGLAGIAWNGGCSYNHDMTVGGIIYRRCLNDLPHP